jgi:hypothetical protein
MALLILGIPLCGFMIWFFWTFSNLDIWMNQIPAIQWTIRALGIVPLSVMLFFISCILGTIGWQFHWDGTSDSDHWATREMKKAFKYQTGKDFPE